MLGSKRPGRCVADIIIGGGILSYDEYENYAGASGLSDMQLLDKMAMEKVVSEDEEARIRAELTCLEFVDLSDFRSELSGIPVAMMYKNCFIPYEISDTTVTIAISDPRSIVYLDELEFVTGKQLEYVVGSKRTILDALKRSEGSSQVLRNIGEGFRTDDLEIEDEEDVISIESLAQDGSPVIKLVNSIIINALQKRASDIHIESSGEDVEVKFRIDGVLYKAMDPINEKFHLPLVSRIKVMSELDISERRIPQDGRFKLKMDGRKIDFRVSILPSIFGEVVVIRILDKEYLAEGYGSLSLETLGFEKNERLKFEKAIHEPYGMVLVTGPTGSGKTTSLYAAVSEINNTQDKIITIEDPVEYQLTDIVQIPVNEKKGLTFAKGLRSILRHDPDKIMVGEIRDPETAYIAIQAALTGHLVFTTVHANNSFDVIGRFTNMGIEPYNFVSSLNCILAQRLVRRICNACKREVNIPKDILQGFNIKTRQTTFFEGIGCLECNGTGFKGREAITEFVYLSDQIKEMILDRKPSSEIRKQAVSEGLTTLRESAEVKFFKGSTTLSEINRVTFID